MKFMKKGLFSLLAILCMTSIFTACSKDDNGPTIPPPTVTSVEGVYKGELKIVEGDAAPAADDDATGIKQKVYITKISDSKIKMEIKNFAFGPLELGNIAVDECDVVITGSKVAFTGAQTITLNLVGACDVDLKGVIDGEQIMLDINVLQTSMNLNIDVKFAGAKMEADQSSEAVMTSFTFPADKVTVQPKIEGSKILFTYDAPASGAPIIVVSAGATVTPKSEEMVDFSVPVKYTVVSEDGITTKEYTVERDLKAEFLFDEWATIKSPTAESTESFQIPVGIWGSTNNGVMTMNDMLSSNFGRKDYPVTPTDDAKQGTKAASIKTLYTYFETPEGADFNAVVGVPYVTAGSLYPGSFLLEDFENMLGATRFGIPFNGIEPGTFHGFYKYTPGTEYRDEKNKVVADGSDKFAIYALLYTEELDAKGKNIPLDGHTIRESNRIVCKAEVAYAGAKSDWTEFNITFSPVNSAKYNPAKNHYLAIIATSSFEGDSFRGAPESLLAIDDFKILAKAK